MKRASKIANAIKNVGQIKEGLINKISGLPETESSKERIAICNACDEIDNSGNGCAIPLPKIPCCGICGCVISVKSTVPDAECPIGKWDVVKIKDKI
jgi:hypothetical protein